MGQGLALPSESNYRVKIKIANIELLTDEPIITEGNYSRWKHRFPQQAIKLPYIDVRDIGKVYVYLMSGKDPICFYSADIEDFINPNPDL